MFHSLSLKDVERELAASVGAAAAASIEAPLYLDQGYGGVVEHSSSRRHLTFAPPAFTDFFQPLIFCIKFLSVSISFTEFCPYLII